jgi:hypothetical protein
VILALLAAVFIGVALAGSPSTQVSHTVDTRLCPFPLDITVKSRDEIHQEDTTALRFRFIGPSTITLRNASTGRTAVLNASGSFAIDTTTGSFTFWGHQVWFWSAGKHVPFMSTDGKGRLEAPYFVLSGAEAHARVIDPCALVAASPPSTRSVTRSAPWRLPAFALSQINHAGLIPEFGNLLRHDHVHLDLIVNGEKVTIPAGVGFAEPVDQGRGTCPRTPETRSSGDCASGHFFTARVANSPLHTHSTSGIIHVESDRTVTFTVGQFFDEWGVRFDSSCLGGYCTGQGKELRVYVNGKRVFRDPRSIVLGNHQEIAVVFGAAGAFNAVPSTYTGGWPGLGCGGAGERSCLPEEDVVTHA